MSFESTTLSLLEGDSSITAIVPKEKITFGTASEDETGPLIACYRISTTPTLSTDNGQPGSSELDNIRLQISFWARDYAEANTLAKLIRRRLEAARPTIFILQDQRSSYDDPTDLFGMLQDYSCWHPDTVPS
jgi:hypothetical protein